MTVTTTAHQRRRNHHLQTTNSRHQGWMRIQAGPCGQQIATSRIQTRSAGWHDDRCGHSPTTNRCWLRRRPGDCHGHLEGSPPRQCPPRVRHVGSTNFSRRSPRAAATSSMRCRFSTDRRRVCVESSSSRPERAWIRCVCSCARSRTDAVFRWTHFFRATRQALPSRRSLPRRTLRTECGAGQRGYQCSRTTSDIMPRPRDVIAPDRSGTRASHPS